MLWLEVVIGHRDSKWWHIADLFTTSQVDQVELSRQLLLVLEVLLLHVDQEDRVTAGAVLIHVWKPFKNTHNSCLFRKELPNCNIPF